MRGRDQIDATLAKYFAWAFARPSEVADVADVAARLRASERPSAPVPADLPPPAIDERELERSREKARALCRPLAAAVDEAWALGAGEPGARATKRVLARADRLGVELAGMDAFPAQAVRLVRLAVRHAATLTRRQRERAAAAAASLALEHPEVADLLVEVARAGDREMASALLSDEDWTPDVGDEEGLAARLADVVDAGPTHPCRVVALELLARLARRGAAVPALRRALRLPSFAVRARALGLLASAEPCAVADDDLVHVLRDLVTHAMPEAARDDDREEDERILADAIVTALAHVQPFGAEEALLDLIDAEHDALWLDAGWATEALAVAFPDTASAMVDHWLKCARGHERARALPALERLPDRLAEPRLRLAAADPAADVRERARRQWLERFGRACPFEPTDLPGAAILERPPSARFASRLAAIHGRVREARRAMARVLLEEAPDREALVLLLQLVADDAESAEPSFAWRESESGGWAAVVVQRFGAAGVRGLCELAARFPEPESFGWMRRLGDLVERGVIAKEHAAPLRELAASHVASDDVGRVDDALRVLALVGAPPELLDRLIAFALDDDLGASEARAIVVSWPDRALDARLTSEMALALAERAWPRLGHAAWMALARGAPAARVIAQRVLELADREPDAVDAAVVCARHLRDAGALDDRWALAALARTDSPIFAVAARTWRHDGAVRAALEAALSSTARGGASAVQAAVALLHGEPRLSPRDRRLAAVLQSAAPADRAELLYAMCMRGAPLSVTAPHLEELLVSADPGVTGALVGVALWLKSPRARALLRRLLPRVADVELRADIEEALGTSPASYWAEG